jgi:hypothetical protein
MFGRVLSLQYPNSSSGIYKSDDSMWPRMFILDSLQALSRLGVRFGGAKEELWSEEAKKHKIGTCQPVRESRPRRSFAAKEATGRREQDWDWALPESGGNIHMI